MASDKPHGPSRGFVCLPRSLPKRLYRLIPSISILKAPEGVPRTGRPCKRCLGSSWEAAKLRLRHLRTRGPVKTSTGVGTEPPPCRDAVVMANAPTEDGSPTLTSSSSVWRSEDDCTKSSSRVSRRPPRYHRGRVRGLSPANVSVCNSPDFDRPSFSAFERLPGCYQAQKLRAER